MNALLESRRTEETLSKANPQRFTKSHHGSLTWLILETHPKLCIPCNVPSYTLAFSFNVAILSLLGWQFSCCKG